MSFLVRGLTIVMMCMAVLTAVPSRSVALVCQAQNQPLIRLTEAVCEQGLPVYEVLELQPDALSTVLPSGVSPLLLLIGVTITAVTILLSPIQFFAPKPLSPPPRAA